MADAPIARSPIRPPQPLGLVNGWEVSLRRTEAPLRLADLTPLRKTLIRGAEASFDIPYGRARLDGFTLVVGSSPNEWTIIDLPTAATYAPVTGFVTVIDITHGRALVRLTGAAAPRLLAKLCPIDLSDSMCPDRAAFRATVANVVTDVVRQDQSGISSYLLHCERSSGQFLFDKLLDAGAEFRIDVDGFPSQPF